jgi:serine/threonine protein kinase
MELGRFRVLSEIGSGSHSTVYLATDGQLKLAIKRVDMSGLAEEDKSHAQDEATLLSKLKHPTIVDYREAFLLNDKKLLCICMEYCEHGDLFSLIQRTLQRKSRTLSVTKQLMDESVCLDWLVQLSLALEYLHRNNVLHRDVKPQNIFLSRPLKEFNSDGSAKFLVKLGDFGVAKQLHNKRDLTTTQIGTPFNMSPEIFTQSPYSFKTDVWSLACVICECYQGVPPFDANSFLSLRTRVLNDAPKIINQFQPLPILLTRMLKKDARNRPTAKDILHSATVSPYIPSVLESIARASVTHLTALVDQLTNLDLGECVPTEALAFAHRIELKGARRALPRSIIGS